VVPAHSRVRVECGLETRKPPAPCVAGDTGIENRDARVAQSAGWTLHVPSTKSMVP
jgi:hypothetical protein